MKHVGPLSVAAPQIEASPHRAAWVPAVVGIGLVLTVVWALFLAVEAVKLLWWAVS